MQQVYMGNVFRELNCNQTITVSGDEHLENLVSIQQQYFRESATIFPLQLTDIFKRIFLKQAMRPLKLVIKISFATRLVQPGTHPAH